MLLSPSDIAQKTVETGKSKANLTTGKILLLGILAGIFIALAGVGASIGSFYGGKLAGALIFPIGLAMVIIAGSELFTGNNLLGGAGIVGLGYYLIYLKNKKIDHNGLQGMVGDTGVEPVTSSTSKTRSSQLS